MVPTRLQELGSVKIALAASPELAVILMDVIRVGGTAKR